MVAGAAWSHIIIDHTVLFRNYRLNSFISSYSVISSCNPVRSTLNLAHLEHKHTMAHDLLTGFAMQMKFSRKSYTREEKLMCMVPSSNMLIAAKLFLLTHMHKLTSNLSMPRI